MSPRALRIHGKTGDVFAAGGMPGNRNFISRLLRLSDDERERERERERDRPTEENPNHDSSYHRSAPFVGKISNAASYAYYIATSRRVTGSLGYYGFNFRITCGKGEGEGETKKRIDTMNHNRAIPRNFLMSLSYICMRLARSASLHQNVSLRGFAILFRSRNENVRIVQKRLPSFVHPISYLWIYLFPNH